MKKMQDITYILECSDQTLYTGWTNNICQRLAAHNSKQGSKYTRGRTPVKLVYLEIQETKQEAMRREAAIKKLTRKEKEALISRNQKALSELLKKFAISEAFWPQNCTS